MSGPSFLGMAQDLIHDSEAKAAFDADPDGFLAARGFDGLSAEDVTDAVGFVADTLPPEAAQQLTAPELEGEALGRLAGLEPADAGSDDPGPVLALSDDPSGELDLLDPGEAPGTDDMEEDPMAAREAGDEEGVEDDPTTQGKDDDETGNLYRPVETQADPGFGVGYKPEDADDVSPAAPEFASLLDHPLDMDLDATHVSDLAFDSADPIGEAISWAHDDEAAPERQGDDDGEHDDHHAAGHPHEDGHLDL